MLSKVIIFQFSLVFEASEANILPYGIKTYVQACHMEQKNFLCGVRGVSGAQNNSLNMQNLLVTN